MTIRMVRSGECCSALTPVELGVFRLMASGHKIQKIAGLFGISDETVKYHLKRVFVKLGARNRAHAVAIAAEDGLMAREEAPVRMRATFRSSLTPTQLRVLRLMGGGHKVQQIAQLVGISEHTVKYHLKRVFRKLGARSRAHAVAIAAARGLMDREQVYPEQLAA